MSGTWGVRRPTPAWAQQSQAGGSYVALLRRSETREGEGGSPVRGLGRWATSDGGGRERTQPKRNIVKKLLSK
jgi:hypothetical protein